MKDRKKIYEKVPKKEDQLEFSLHKDKENCVITSGDKLHLDNFLCQGSQDFPRIVPWSITETFPPWKRWFLSVRRQGYTRLDQFPSSISRHPSNNYRFFLLARQASGLGERNRKLNKSTEKKREVTFGQTRFDSCQTLQAALQMHVQPLYGFSISFTLFSPSFCGLGEESRA